MIALGLSGFCIYRLLSYNNMYFRDTDHSPITDFMPWARFTALDCKFLSMCHQMEPHLGLNMGTCAPFLTAVNDRHNVTHTATHAAILIHLK